MKALILTASIAALSGCASLGPHVDRCEQHLNDEGRWVYAAPGCPQIGGGKSLPVPVVSRPDSPPDPVDPPDEPDHPVDPPKDPKPDHPPKDKPKKPKSDNSDSNQQGGNHHNREDKPQGPKDKKP